MSAFTCAPQDSSRAYCFPMSLWLNYVWHSMLYNYLRFCGAHLCDIKRFQLDWKLRLLAFWWWQLYTTWMLACCAKKHTLTWFNPFSHTFTSLTRQFTHSAPSSHATSSPFSRNHKSKTILELCASLTPFQPTHTSHKITCLHTRLDTHTHTHSWTCSHTRTRARTCR